MEDTQPLNARDVAIGLTPKTSATTEQLAQRDSTLDPAVLWDAGVAMTRDRTMIRDWYDDWYRMAWDSHEGRYCCEAAHVDAVLRRATVR